MERTEILAGRPHGNSGRNGKGGPDERCRRLQTFDLAQLLRSALTNRADLAALRHGRDAAQAGIHLAKTGRIPDVDVGVGVTHSTASENTIAPAPSFNGVGLTLSFPLPVFDRKRGEIDSARLTYEQSEKILAAAEQKAEIEIRQAHARYQVSLQRAARFKSETLAGRKKF
jgi:outer membrane protein, heavy metal efflux system